MVQSQVISYLRELSKKGFNFVLATFDRHRRIDYKEKANHLKKELYKNKIRWVSLKYHNFPNLPATAYDILQGVLYCSIIIKKHHIKTIHARSYVAGIIAALLKKFKKTRFIFDIRGVLIDERVDAGLWKKDSVKYKICKKIEQWLFCQADEIITLSRKSILLIRKDFLKNKKTRITYIPTCVDLERFKFNSKQRDVLRKRLNLNNKFVIVYSGAVGRWYLLKEMIEFCTAFKKINKNSHFLLLTKANNKQLQKIMMKKINRTDFSILSVSYKEMNKYLSIADAGILFTTPCYSLQFGCPTKFAEYLACGLPIVCNNYDGNIENTLIKKKAGIIVNKLDDEGYIKAVKELIKIKKDKNLPQRCRALAETEYNVKEGAKKYLFVYRNLLKSVQEGD